jgi:hypothetical protein
MPNLRRDRDTKKPLSKAPAPGFEARGKTPEHSVN